MLKPQSWRCCRRTTGARFRSPWFSSVSAFSDPQEHNKPQSHVRLRASLSAVSRNDAARTLICGAAVICGRGREAEEVVMMIFADQPRKARRLLSWPLTTLASKSHIGVTCRSTVSRKRSALAARRNRPSAMIVCVRYATWLRRPRRCSGIWCRLLHARLAGRRLSRLGGRVARPLRVRVQNVGRCAALHTRRTATSPCRRRARGQRRHPSSRSSPCTSAIT
jgi:hypothetical protein